MKRLGLAAFLACMGMQAQGAGNPGDMLKSMGPLLARDGNDAGVFRGGVVYGNYCVTCHGINADGNGRAARLYAPRPANLRASDKNDEYILMIVRMGGAAVGRSEFMPPWGAELTEEQMKDVTAYLRAINAASR
jgi:mono/diheme cytochrome c family protein